MSKPTKDPVEKVPENRIELVPDAWSRFERFVKNIAKAGPQHRIPKSEAHKKPGTEPKGKVKKGRMPK